MTLALFGGTGWSKTAAAVMAGRSGALELLRRNAPSILYGTMSFALSSRQSTTG